MTAKAQSEEEITQTDDPHQEQHVTTSERFWSGDWACIRGAVVSHQRQMEWRQKRPPEEWRGYQRLGVAVIASAVQDLKKPTRAGKESVQAGESARAFLTVSNSNLKFWCGVADFDMNAILRTYCQREGRSRESSAMS
jgi:hypothetical protein